MGDPEEEREQNERERRSRAVEDSWPFDKDGNRKHNGIAVHFGDNAQQHQKAAQKLMNMLDGTDSTDYGPPADRKKGHSNAMMTEQEMLDSAPIPVLNTEFDEGYDPFKPKKAPYMRQKKRE